MTTSDQLPAVIEPAVLLAPADTYIGPALIADLGDAANWRYVEFFTANINNDHTRPLSRRDRCHLHLEGLPTRGPRPLQDHDAANGSGARWSTTRSCSFSMSLWASSTPSNSS